MALILLVLQWMNVSVFHGCVSDFCKLRFVCGFEGQRGYSSRPTKIDFCWEAARGWANACRLQHPERVHSSSCSEIERRNYDQGQDPYRERN
nr:hypothetical protein [Tanacetum cinerariifolium]